MPISIIAAFLLVSDHAPAAPAAKPVDPDKKVCKTIGETGSRLGGTRECHTQSEWNRIAAEAQQKAMSKMGN